MLTRIFRTHPSADLFPMMSDTELSDVAAYINKNGLRHPIVLDHGGNLLVDGRNRQRACDQVGVEPTYVQLPEDADLAAYVVSANLHRRHLTAEQKRELISKLLDMDPEKSDRSIASQVQVDHKTVAAVRSGKEDRGEIPNTETRTDASGREQPAHKPAPAMAHEAAKIVRMDAARDRKKFAGQAEELVAILRELPSERFDRFQELYPRTPKDKFAAALAKA